jgi:hypothetical protein
MEPTPKQAIAAIRVYAQLTRVYKTIDLVRFHELLRGEGELKPNTVQLRLKPFAKVNFLT